jgi:hypothetical protein
MMILINFTIFAIIAGEGAATIKPNLTLNDKKYIISLQLTKNKRIENS